MADVDPHEEIERLEARIDELFARLESCRKFILAGRIAILCGGVLLALLLLDVIRFDARLVTLAIAAVLGGIVAWGTNNSTANEAAGELSAAERERAALIEQLDLQPVSGSRTLH